MFINGDVDYGVWTAGPVMGVIKDIPTCEVLLKRIEKEGEETINKISSFVKPDVVKSVAKL